VTRAGSTREGDGPYDVWTVADAGGAEERAERALGGGIGGDRERALVEAGRLYGRDHARARAALADGTHPLCRLKRPAG
jgi:hypothetical protein